VRRLRGAAAAAISATAFWAAAPAHAGDAGAPEVPPPTGRDVAPVRLRPDAAAVPVVACSFDPATPVCVHAAASIHPAAVLATLADAEHALGAYAALGLPRPLSDDDLGGSSAYDVYLVRGAEPPATTIDLVARGEPIDRASAFSVLPPPSARSGCEAARDVAHAIADAIAFRFDAGIEAGALSMASSYLASLAAPCESAELAAIDDFQRAPERELAGGAMGALDGSLLFPWMLDDLYGASRPVILSLVAIARQKTPPGSWQWNNEPDVFDALRATLKATGSSLDALLLDFAIARAFVGSRSDGAHLSDVARFGAAGRVRFEWSLPYGSLPRRVAPGAPIEPTGATYLWVDLAGAPKGASVTFAADWELPVVFGWALVKVDANGAEVGRTVVTAPHGQTHVERTLEGLDGLAGLLVVGSNAGSMDRAEPFDPDEPFVPHSYLVTIYP
jgi:hypothetical protein